MRISEEYDIDTHTKSIIALKYIIDAQDFMIRIEILSKGDRNFSKSYNAKLYVDFINAIECCLKSVFISLSDKSIKYEMTYKKLKEKGHNIESLRSSIENKGEKRFDEFKTLFSTLQTLNVKLRYSVELIGIQKELYEEGDENEEKYKIINDHKYILTNFDALNRIYDISDEIYTEHLSKFRIARLAQGFEIMDRISKMLCAKK